MDMMERTKRSRVCPPLYAITRFKQIWNDYSGKPSANPALLFIVVSRAFQILSDAEKKAKFDRFGGDPDNRFGGGSAASTSSPFSGFARSPSGGSRMYEEEISPDELFNRFFSGGMGGGGFGPFGTVASSSDGQSVSSLTIS